MTIEAFKVRVIELALGFAATYGFALAGGNAAERDRSLTRYGRRYFAELQVSRDDQGTQLDLGRYSRRQLLELAFIRDRGLRPADAALAVQWLDRLDDDQFRPYRLSDRDVAAVRARIASWPRDPARDDDARAAHAAANGPPATAGE